MTKIGKVAGIALTVAVLGMAAYLMVPAKHVKTMREMKFPKGAHLTGDPKTGALCAEYHRRYPDGRDVMLTSHTIPGRDFRAARDDNERKAWIIEDAVNVTESLGLVACNADPGFYFQDASAQPKCTDCNGGCGGWACPATLLSPGCALGGVTCVIVFVCCDGCVPNCDA